MAENKKWSDKTLITSTTNTTEICILDGVTADNKRISAVNLLKEKAPKTNPAGGQNNYAPLTGPIFTGSLTIGENTITENRDGGISLPQGTTIGESDIATLNTLDDRVPFPTLATQDAYLRSNDDGTSNWSYDVAPKANPVFTGNLDLSSSNPILSINGGTDSTAKILLKDDDTNVFEISSEGSEGTSKISSPARPLSIISNIVKVLNLQTFADNTAAAALATNTLYKTSTGVLMIKY